jgi:hypothetical protein
MMLKNLNRLIKTSFFKIHFTHQMNILRVVKSKCHGLLLSIFNTILLFTFDNLNGTAYYSTRYKFYYSCFCFSNICPDFSTDCYSTTYKFYYSSLCFSNMCLDLDIYTLCILLELFTFYFTV